mgnify:CR=1 FL=1|jgi:molecular chaperone IbpA|tara:strand:- start:16673 stop:17083 length:411 start_codon:yes stop_codon:yes gene_type:complete
MSTLFYEYSPFDILVRNFFNDAGNFNTLADSKLQHPVDIYQTDKGLSIDIACTGIAKDDIEIQLQDNLIRVIYDKSKESDQQSYIHKGIAKRSFNLGWKIDSKFDLSKSDAKFENGLLSIAIPFSKGSELKTLKIN